MLVAVGALEVDQPALLPVDGQLIEQSLGGDQDAFARIVEKYQKKIYRVALAIVQNDMDADAVTQDTFIQAYLNLSRFEGRSELETWLTRIAINKARDTIRSRRWLFFASDQDIESGQIPEPADPRPDAESETAARQMMAAIERVVRKLSRQQQTIFRLRHYEDMSCERIAELMQLNPGTVRAHLFRAIRNLRKELKELDPRGTRTK